MYDDVDDDDRRPMMTIPHMTCWVRWVKKCEI